jgi:hypothetical protein
MKPISAPAVSCSARPHSGTPLALAASWYCTLTKFDLGEHGLLLRDLAGVRGAIEHAIEGDGQAGRVEDFGAGTIRFGRPTVVLDGQRGAHEFAFAEGIAGIDGPLLRIGGAGGGLQQDDAFGGGRAVFLVDDGGDFRVGLEHEALARRRRRDDFIIMGRVGWGNSTKVQSRLRSFESRRRISR